MLSYLGSQSRDYSGQKGFPLVFNVFLYYRTVATQRKYNCDETLKRPPFLNLSGKESFSEVSFPQLFFAT